MDHTFAGNEDRAIAREDGRRVTCPYEVRSIEEEYPPLLDLLRRVRQEFKLISRIPSKSINPLSSKQNRRFTVETRHQFVLNYFM